jgi:LytTr DNA-binding domain
VKPFRGR